MDTKTKNRLNKYLAQYSTGKTTLEDFLKVVSTMHPALSQCLEGIYCGTCDSRIPTACAMSHEQIPGTKYYLVFGWYADANSNNKPRVEYAYIS